MSIDLAKLKALAEAATPGPWRYRPDKYDDWGYVRGPSDDEIDIGWTIAVVSAGRHVSVAEKDEHRRTETDPYGDNAQFIAAANPTAVLALIDRVEELERALKPFADEASEWETFHETEHLVEKFENVVSELTVGHLRAARKALEVKP